MLKLIAVFAIVVGALASCDKFALQKDVDDLSGRVASLEKLVEDANINITFLQVAVDALRLNVAITGVEELSDGSGYTIKFSDGKSVVVKNGKNGEDGRAPAIGIKQDSDGLYYWTLDGNWLLVNGKKVRANGIDGKNGEDGVTPKLRIYNGVWQVSADDGKTWSDVSTTGEYVIIKSIDTSDPAFVVITLQDGTELRFSRGSAGGVQSLEAVPFYSDGSVAAVQGVTTLKFKVFPANAAEALAALPVDDFNVSAVYTSTKASVGDELDLPILSVENVDGTLNVDVFTAFLGKDFFDKSITASAVLSVDDGTNCIHSGYFSLYHGTKGYAPVKKSAGRPGNKCAWVQLWDGGPRIAEFNVGATIDDYGKLQSGTDPVSGNLPYYNTANVGGLYTLTSDPNGRIDPWDWNRIPDYHGIPSYRLWGANWREPYVEDLYDLQDKYHDHGLVFEWCDGVDIQYCEGCTLAGEKISGKPGTPYENNSIFFPAAGWYSPNGSVREVEEAGYYGSFDFDDDLDQYQIGFSNNDSDRFIFTGDPKEGLSSRPVILEECPTVAVKMEQSNNYVDEFGYHKTVVVTLYCAFWDGCPYQAHFPEGLNGMRMWDSHKSYVVTPKDGVYEVVFVDRDDILKTGTNELFFTIDMVNHEDPRQTFTVVDHESFSVNIN